MEVTWFLSLSGGEAEGVGTLAGDRGEVGTESGGQLQSNRPTQTVLHVQRPTETAIQHICSDEIIIVKTVHTVYKEKNKVHTKNTSLSSLSTLPEGRENCSQVGKSDCGITFFSLHPSSPLPLPLPLPLVVRGQLFQQLQALTQDRLALAMFSQHLTREPSHVTVT